MKSLSRLAQDLYKANRMAVGGPSPSTGTSDEKKHKPIRPDDSLEPVFFHTMPEELFDDLVPAFNCNRVINLAASDGALELVCIERNIPCTSFCLTDVHITRLVERLECEVYKRMQQPKNKFLFQKSLKADIDSRGDTSLDIQ